MVSLCPQITWRGKQRAINDRTYIVHCTEHTEKMIFARIQLIWYLHDWHFGERDKFLWLELQEVKFFPLQSVWIAEINLFFLDSEKQLWIACWNCVYDSSMIHDGIEWKRTRRSTKRNEASAVKRRKQKKRTHKDHKKREKRADFNRYAMTKCWKVWGAQAWPDEKHLMLQLYAKSTGIYWNICMKVNEAKFWWNDHLSMSFKSPKKKRGTHAQTDFCEQIHARPHSFRRHCIYTTTQTIFYYAHFFDVFLWFLVGFPLWMLFCYFCWCFRLFW